MASHKTLNDGRRVMHHARIATYANEYKYICRIVVAALHDMEIRWEDIVGIKALLT